MYMCSKPLIGMRPQTRSSRRRFLKGTAAGAGAFAFGGLSVGTAAAQETTVGVGEVGTEISRTTTDEWDHVTFSDPFTQTLSDLGENAIVTMKPPSYRGTQPVHIRLRNVDQEGFDYQLEEWDYQDEVHRHEKIFWVALAPVIAEIPTASGAAFSVRAGEQPVDTSGTSVNFGLGTFDSRPVVIPQAQTYNGKADSIITRLNGGVEKTGFNMFVQEQEANQDYHRTEEGGYIAVEVPRFGSLVDTDGTVMTEFEARRPTRPIQDSPSEDARIPFVINDNDGFGSNPRVVTAMQTRSGPQPANLRRTELTRDHMELFVDEEQSADSETAHVREDAGFLAFGSNALLNGEDVQVTV